MSKNTLRDNLKKSLQDKIVPRLLELMSNLEIDSLLTEEGSGWKSFFEPDGNIYFYDYNEDNDTKGDREIDFDLHDFTEIGEDDITMIPIDMDDLEEIAETLLEHIDELSEKEDKIISFIKKANKFKLLYQRELLIEKNKE